MQAAQQVNTMTARAAVWLAFICETHVLWCEYHAHSTWSQFVKIRPGIGEMRADPGSFVCPPIPVKSGGIVMEWSFLFFFNSALLGVGLAMDAFSVSMANGLHDPQMSRRRVGVYGCQSKKESMNYETVIKDVIMYSQDNLVAMEGKTPEEVLKMYEEADKDIDERFGQTFTKEALNDLKIKDITNIQEKLSHYTLPIEISKIIVKEDTTSTVTVQFVDHQKKHGEMIFRVQDTNNEINYFEIE